MLCLEGLLDRRDLLFGFGHGRLRADQREQSVEIAGQKSAEASREQQKRHRNEEAEAEEEVAAVEKVLAEERKP